MDTYTIAAILVVPVLAAVFIFLAIYFKKLKRAMNNADMFLAAQRIEDGLDAYARVYKRFPLLPIGVRRDILKNLVAGYASIGANDKARSYLTEAEKHMPYAAAEYKMGYLFNAGDFEECMSLANDCISPSKPARTRGAGHYFKGLIEEDSLGIISAEEFLEAAKTEKNSKVKTSMVDFAVSDAIDLNRIGFLRKLVGSESTHQLRYGEFLAMLEKRNSDAKKIGIDLEEFTEKIFKLCASTRKRAFAHTPLGLDSSKLIGNKSNEMFTADGKLISHLGGKPCAASLESDNLTLLAEINLKDVGGVGIIELFVGKDCDRLPYGIVSGNEFRVIYLEKVTAEKSVEQSEPTTDELPLVKIRFVNIYDRMSANDPRFSPLLFEKLGVTKVGTSDYFDYDYFFGGTQNTMLSQPMFYSLPYDLNTEKYDLKLFGVSVNDDVYSFFMPHESFAKLDFSDVILYKERMPEKSDPSLKMPTAYDEL